MTTTTYHCRSCNWPYSVLNESLPKYSGKSIRCRKCHCENAFTIPVHEIPEITEITELAVAHVSLRQSCQERWGACWDALIDVRDFLGQDPKRAWIAFVMALVLFTVVYREFKEFQSGWRFRSRLAYQQKAQEIIEAKRLEVAQQQNVLFDKRRAAAKESERRKAAEDVHATATSFRLPSVSNKQEPVPVQDGPAKLDEPTEVPVEIDDRQVEAEESETFYPIDSGPRELTFTNGVVVIVQPNDETSKAAFHHMASTNKTASGINLAVQQAGRRDLISYFSSEGKHVKSVEIDLFGTQSLLMSPNGRYVTNLSFVKADVRRICVIDVESNQRVLQANGRPICFSQDSKHLAIYMDSGELRVWKLGTDFDPASDPATANSLFKVGRVISGAFIRPDLLLVGTREGHLKVVDVRSKTVLDQIQMNLPIEKVCIVSGEDKAVLVLGFQNHESVPQGQATVVWMDFLINEQEVNGENGVSRFDCHLKERGRRPGNHPLLTKDGHHMAFLDNVPTGRSPKETFRAISIYSTRQPNKLQRMLSAPLKLASLECFCNSGKRLFGKTLNSNYVVLDLETRKAFVLDETDKGTSREGKKPTSIEVIESVDDSHFATCSRSGKVTLFRIPDCLDYVNMVNKEKGISPEVIRKIGYRGWSTGKGRGTPQGKATAIGYKNGRIILRTKDRKKREIPLVSLSRWNQEYLAWLVSGPTEERKWQLRRRKAASSLVGAFGVLTGDKDTYFASITGRLVGMDGPAIFIDEQGKQVRYKKSDFSRAQLIKIVAMSNNRIRGLLPNVEQVEEAKVLQGPSPLEGTWEIVRDLKNTDSLLNPYVDRRSRTVVFEGDRMHYPLFVIGAENGAKVRWWYNYRFIYYPKSKMLVRCFEGLGGVFVETPMLMRVKGDRVELTHVILGEKGATWVLKKIKDDQMKIRPYASQQGGMR